MITLPVLWEMMQDREEMQEVLKDLSAKCAWGTSGWDLNC